MASVRHIHILCLSVRPIRPSQSVCNNVFLSFFDVCDGAMALAFFAFLAVETN
jgi:hypothetical protein